MSNHALPPHVPKTDAVTLVFAFFFVFVLTLVW